MTASRLVQERIIVEAKRLLTRSDAGIAVIAVIAKFLGFEDSAYFARLFRKGIGQTPKQFKSAFEDNVATECRMDFDVKAGRGMHSMTLRGSIDQNTDGGAVNPT